ncbi:BF3164 family lipoprotein [Belliella pelovolcani]|uniref:TolB-like 6-blade propeller-like n=1 Tax=Belliella pelovolcani TaxID=529505 RepID=A0A1N7PVA7_9BACT|nr:BF3164 family lipoprotein [Belliella pelovolcani]SIT14379.1 TolB-like 6-blade propeller-like [Belliella pelovolcani]
MKTKVNHSFRFQINLWIPFLLIAILLSCKENTKEDISIFELSEFETVEKLKAEYMSIASTHINRAYDLLILNDNLIVSDPNSEKHFKIIGLSNEAFLGSFGRIGNGPCEIQFPASIQILNESSSVIGVNNRKNFGYREIFLDENQFNSMKDSCLKDYGKFDYNYQKIIKLDEKNLVGTGLFEQRFALSSIDNGSIISEFGKYPFEEELSQYDHNVLAMAYQGEIIKHPKKPLFISTSINSFNFDIIALNTDNSLSVIAQKHYWSPLFNGVSGNAIQATMTSDNKKGCLSTTVTEKYIYILYSGKSRKEGGVDSNTILVYDWEGKPVKLIKSDKNLNLIAADAKGKYLIGYHDDGQPNLFKITLN